ncbi:MAG: N-acetylneuraminate synthase family protein [Acidobacteria bacterium]|nr:N-acetylneuraminate synthase family protein [Acidobacteriota bacterium]
MACQVIAEIGWNHMGDMDLARRMIDAAAGAGADVVKFQTWRVSRLKPGPWDTDGRREIYIKAELSDERHQLLLDACRNAGVQFMTSLFDVRDAEFVASLDRACVKIPSPEATNAELLAAVDGRFDRVYVSTGASTWDEVQTIPSRVTKSALTMLHCVSKYPCPPDEVNLPRMAALRGLTPSVGYSGHLDGTADAVAAIALGADVVEKHFTLDRDLPGRDNKFALLPADLQALCGFRNDFVGMTRDCGLDLQESERDVHTIFRGRWSA